MKNDRLLIVISGPSGAGKGTVVNELKKSNNIKVSVSATTRQPRKGEINGVHYHFISNEQFEKMTEENGFLEHAGYCDNYYGSPKKQAEEWLAEGNDVILEIDVQGYEQVKRNFPDCVGIFIMPPSIAELERRLRKRGTEDENTIKKRLDRAREEIMKADKYDYVVVNGPLRECVEDVLSVINAEKHTSKRWTGLTE